MSTRQSRRFAHAPNSTNVIRIARSFRLSPTRLSLRAALFCVIACASLEAANASDEVVRVEEDWCVVIDTPDPDGHAPQIVTAMSSTDELADVHAVFELNHGTLPDYTSGGMQLQCWSEDLNLDYREAPKWGILSTPDEVVTYTMSMKLADGRVQFEVTKGESITWGKFGGAGWLQLSIPTSQTGFPYYSPETSVRSSRIGFAAHRVRKFYLKEVRYYSQSGLVQTDCTERVVHELAENDD